MENKNLSTWGHFTVVEYNIECLQSLLDNRQVIENALLRISLPLASITLFVDFAIPIVVRPSMSFIKGLVMGVRIQCYDVIEPPPSHRNHKFHNFHTFQKN